MIKIHLLDLVKLVFAFLLALSQFSVKTASANVSMIHPGDEVDGMTLTTGAADAHPLWAFCSSQVSKNLTKADCRVPLVAELAIGHIFRGTEEALGKADWSQLDWELYLDDQLISLEDFGTYRYVRPDLAPKPSRVREVFRQLTAWDIVLTDLQPGAHEIRGWVRADGQEHRWEVDLLIEDDSISPESALDDPHGRSLQSKCPQGMKRVSPFQNSCRIYG